MDGVELIQGYSHLEEAVYFLPFSSEKFLVLILSTSEGSKDESTLEPPSGWLIVVPSYHPTQFKRKIKNKTWKHGEKTWFRPNFGFAPNLGPKTFFREFYLY